MKALQILMWIQQKNDISFISKKKIDEAIEELKNLQNKCEDCKYHLSQNGCFPLEPCGECSLFYANQWESK